MLVEGLSRLGFTKTEIEPLAQKLSAYADELDLFNEAYGLTAARSRNDILIRHILDSLAAGAEILQLKNKTLKNRPTEGGKADSFIIADIGSGGGLPGIPLAISMPDTSFVLAERMSKRCMFLENCVSVLKLNNVTVQNIELERIKQNSFDIAVFRAFRPLDKKMIRILLRTLKNGGSLAAYKAKKEKIIAEMELIAAYIPEYIVVPLSVPFLEDHERNLVIIPSKIGL